MSECGVIGLRWYCVKPAGHGGLHAYEERQSGGRLEAGAPKAPLNEHDHYVNCEGCEAIRASARAEGKAEGLDLADDAICEVMDEHWRFGHTLEYHALRSARDSIRSIRSLVPAAPGGGGK